MSDINNQRTSLWMDIRTTINAIFSTVVTTATTVEKTVQLAEREVDNLSEMQLIRIDEIKAERASLQKKLAEA